MIVDNRCIFRSQVLFAQPTTGTCFGKNEVVRGQRQTLSHHGNLNSGVLAFPLLENLGGQTFFMTAEQLPRSNARL